MNSDVRAIAECLNIELPLCKGDRLVKTDRYTLLVSHEEDPRRNVAQRLRLSECDVDRTVDEVRAIYAREGRTQITWEVSDASTPGDLLTRVEKMGMTPDADPVVVGVAMSRELPGAAGSTSLTVRPVTTLQDFAAAEEVYNSAFGMEGAVADDAELAARYEAFFATPGFRRYVASDGGRVVAAADAASLRGTAILCTAATLPDARGKGAFRALVRARWLDAVKAGEPTLVAQAAPMSRPIFKKMGFDEIVKIHVFVDEFRA
jgi:hypothetical protein